MSHSAAAHVSLDFNLSKTKTGLEGTRKIERNANRPGTDSTKKQRKKKKKKKIAQLGRYTFAIRTRKKIQASASVDFRRLATSSLSRD